MGRPQGMHSHTLTLPCHRVAFCVAVSSHEQVMFMNYGNKEDVSWRDIVERNAEAEAARVAQQRRQQVLKSKVRKSKKRPCANFGTPRGVCVVATVPSRRC